VGYWLECLNLRPREVDLVDQPGRPKSHLTNWAIKLIGAIKLKDRIKWIEAIKLWIVYVKHLEGLEKL
jgi:hypothetical protein